jgi:hypothetical protein
VTVIIAIGRLFARATGSGRHWPSGNAWNASLVLDGFDDIVSVLAPGHELIGPRLSIAELFDTLPVAILQARHVRQEADRSGPCRAASGQKLQRNPERKGRPGSRGPDGLADVVPTDQGSVPSLRFRHGCLP